MKKREAEDRKFQDKFRAIINKLGYIPGKLGFRMHMWRDYGIKISVRRCAHIMKEMHLVASLPKKDAYKNQATHFHECAAEMNHIQQDFRIGPRRIILTDITYLYYSQWRNVCYLCTFKDAFTSQILGFRVSEKMDVKLVKDAYEMMMKDHGEEFPKDVEVYCHSDQGSQYASASYKELLTNDGFIQSMSARGNSQDNSPQESFFGRMKTALIDLLARCKDMETVVKMIEGYMKSYNTERYQFSLAALAPDEYYLYAMTGVYPLDNYFGVSSTELLSLEDLLKIKKDKAEEKSKKRRERNAARRKERAQVDPKRIFIRDKNIIKKMKKEAEKQIEVIKNEIKHYDDLLKRIDDARRFFLSCDEEVKELLKDPIEWKNYKELDYVFEMGDIF